MHEEVIAGLPHNAHAPPASLQTQHVTATAALQAIPGKFHTAYTVRQYFVTMPITSRSCIITLAYLPRSN
jgi:hypothetical protein